MSTWIQVKGQVQPGHKVASGQNQNPRFPGGTLAMQKPFFRDRGLDLDAYFPGTINLSIAPHRYEVREAKHTFRQVKWSPHDPAEDFSFFDCRILADLKTPLEGLIYYPHPETKPEHFQPPDILEILAPFINGLQYGDAIALAVNSRQITIQ